MTTIDRQQFHLTVESEAGVLTLRLFGVVGPVSARALSACVMDGLAEETIVDLSGVSLMDPAGVKVLVLAYHQAARSGRTLTLRRPSPTVVNALRRSGADQVLAATA